MPSRFVRPGTRRLSLSDGDWILVRTRLSAGDNREMLKRFYVTDRAGSCPKCRTELETIRRLDTFESTVATVLAYLVDWSITDDDTGEIVNIRDEPVDVVRATLDALDPDTFVEIRQAIDAHVDAMDAERAEEKKRRAGATTSNATSPSPDAVTGVTSGSAT